GRPESVDTPSLVGAFGGGHSAGAPPGARTAIPAAARYRLIVFRSTPTVAWIRRADHPSRPTAKTCCFFSSPKTFLPGGGTMIPPPRQRLGPLPLVADFQVSISGGFCPSTEAKRRNRNRGCVRDHGS